MKKITNIRKSVCIMANELKKAGYTLSQAFKKSMAQGKITDDHQSSRNHVREQTRAIRVLKTLPSGKPESHTEKRRGKPIRPQCDPDHSPYSRNQQKNRDWICASKISQRAVTGDRCRRESGSEAFRDHRRIQL